MKVLAILMVVELFSIANFLALEGLDALCEMLGRLTARSALAPDPELNGNRGTAFERSLPWN